MRSRERDKMDVPMTCADCGKKYTMKYKSLRLSKTDIHRCKDCTMKALQKKLYGETPEEKDNLLKKRNAAIKNALAKQTPEKKKQISDDRIRAWSEDKQRKEELKKRLMQRWSNASEEDKKRQGDILGKGRDQYWMDEKNREFNSERARKKWYEQTIEEQKRIISAANEGLRKFFESETFKEKMARVNRQSENMKKWWENACEEQKSHILDALNKGMRAYFENRTILPNKNEESFIKMLTAHGIVSFQQTWFNKTVAEEFNEIFEKNPVTGSSFVSKYHAWDFIIHCFNKDILVDVDGSIHNLDPGIFICKGKYDAKDNMAFKDSKRIFQTDGLDAYIVECYNDKMTDDTLVRNIYTDEKQRLKDFLIYLEWESLSDDDKKDVIKFAMK